MLAALQELSGYIRHSLLEERSSIWIAQREGRAKDGWDRTEPAIIKMLCISKARETPLAEHVRALNIVPVSISYEWDPCDAAKARELYLRATAGGYEKEEHEDVASIARSITAPKGAVHVSFGEPLAADFAGPDEVAAEIDRQVMALYRVQASNLAALRMLHGRPLDSPTMPRSPQRTRSCVRGRRSCATRPYLLAMRQSLLNRAALDAP
jgi:hypothetical protein